MASLFTPIQLILNLCCEFRLQHVVSVAQGINAAAVFVELKLIQ